MFQCLFNNVLIVDLKYFEKMTETVLGVRTCITKLWYWSFSSVSALKNIIKMS